MNDIIGRILFKDITRRSLFKRIAQAGAVAAVAPLVPKEAEATEPLGEIKRYPVAPHPTGFSVSASVVSLHSGPQWPPNATQDEN